MEGVVNGKIIKSGKANYSVYSNRDGFGEVRMTGKDLKVTLHNAGESKLLLVKYVPEIIRKGAIGAEEPLKHPRKDGMAPFIPITVRMRISDKEERIAEILIGKDKSGKLYYDAFINEKPLQDLYAGVKSRAVCKNSF